MVRNSWTPSQPSLFRPQCWELRKGASGFLVPNRIKRSRMLRGAAGHTGASPGGRWGRQWPEQCQELTAGAIPAHLFEGVQSWHRPAPQQQRQPTAMPCSQRGPRSFLSSGKQGTEGIPNAQQEFLSLQIFSTIHILGSYTCTILVTCSKLFYGHYIVKWDHLQPQKKSCHPALHEETEAETGPGFQGPSWGQSQDSRPHLCLPRGLASLHGAQPSHESAVMSSGGCASCPLSRGCLVCSPRATCVPGWL